MKNYKQWLNAFMESWKNLEGEKTCDLIANGCEYFENPIDPPITDISDIKKLWAIVPDNQKDITYSGKILFENNESCIYHFTMQRTITETSKTQFIDGVFEVKLNDQNLLTYFKQWRFTKEI